jgi:hypothetical protein
MSFRDCSQPPEPVEPRELDIEIEFDPGTDDDDDLPTLRFTPPPAITRKVLRKIQPLPKVSPPPLRR